MGLKKEHAFLKAGKMKRNCKMEWEHQENEKNAMPSDPTAQYETANPKPIRSSPRYVSLKNEPSLGWRIERTTRLETTL